MPLSLSNCWCSAPFIKHIVLFQEWRGREAIKTLFPNIWPRTRIWPNGLTPLGATAKPANSGVPAESLSWEIWKTSRLWSLEPPAAVWTGCCLCPWYGPITCSWAAGETHNGSLFLTSVQQRPEHLCSLSYPPAVMAKIKKMGEGIVVKDAPHHRTTIDGVMAKGKRTTINGKTLLVVSICILQCKRYAI